MFDVIPDTQLAGFARRLVPEMLEAVKKFAASSDSNARLVQTMAEEMRQFWQAESKPPAAAAAKPDSRPVESLERKIEQDFLNSDERALREIGDSKLADLQAYMQAHDDALDKMLANCQNTKATWRCIRLLAANYEMQPSEVKAQSLIKLARQKDEEIERLRAAREQAVGDDETWSEVNSYPSFQDIAEFLATYFLGPEARTIERLELESQVLTETTVNDTGLLLSPISQVQNLFKTSTRPEIEDIKQYLRQAITNISPSNAQAIDQAGLETDSQWRQFDLKAIKIAELPQEIEAGDFLRKLMAHATLNPLKFFGSARSLDIERQTMGAAEKKQAQLQVFFDGFDSFWKLMSELNRKLQASGGQGFANPCFFENLCSLLLAHGGRGKTDNALVQRMKANFKFD